MLVGKEWQNGVRVYGGKNSTGKYEAKPFKELQMQWLNNGANMDFLATIANVCIILLTLCCAVVVGFAYGFEHGYAASERDGAGLISFLARSNVGMAHEIQRLRAKIIKRDCEGDEWKNN